MWILEVLSSVLLESIFQVCWLEAGLVLILILPMSPSVSNCVDDEDLISDVGSKPGSDGF